MSANFEKSQDAFEFTTLKEIIIQLLQNTGYLVDENTTGIASGFDKIDEITKGFQKAELSVFASKPGAGKTAFLLSLLFNIASKSGKTVGVFSPERSAVKMFNRLIESETRQSVKKISAREIKDSEKEQINNILYTLSKAEIYVDDSSSMQKEDFYKRCKQLKNKYGADIVLIDGFELFSYSSITDVEQNTEEQRTVLEDIKAIAKELDLPMIVFSHMINTNALSNGMPSLQNVCEFVELVADSIYLIQRQSVSDIANVVIAKHPNIEEALVVPLKFIESIDKFVDL
ncbi:MAG: DnaB-like helicase C-terminal domain-containing protein [Lentimicrobiaceae bacterium]|nr:DnaB-like helicase C-terminal domain-containing protein [Lentimicrobiaceae bacterium]